MAISEQLKSLVNQMPEADGRGMYTENIDTQKTEKAVVALAKDGKANMLGLIEMLGDPGADDNVKPHYALHCLVNHALIAKDEKLRRELCEAMASQLGNQELHPYNRAYLCQELQWAGRDEACEPLGKVLLDAEVSDAAATALAAIGGEASAVQLRQAVAKAEGKTKLNLIDALAALEDAKSADTFAAAVKDDNRETRIAASLGLAKLGQPESAELLLKAATAAKGWERMQLTKSCLVLAEQLAANGKTAESRRVYESLQKSHTSDNEQHIRDAAERGLAAIA